MKNIFLIAGLLLLAAPAWSQTCIELFGTSSPITPFTIIKIEKNRAQTQSVMDDVVLTADRTQELLKSLFDHTVSENTLTAARIEQRFIVKTRDLDELREDSMTWSLRDTKPEGTEFTTITAYASKIILPLEGNREANAKIRFRKYYKHSKDEVASPDNTQEVFRGFTALELKISGIERAEDGTFKSNIDSVYKPRAFVSDSLLERLLKYRGSDFKDAKKIQALIEEITATPYAPQTFNERQAVEQLIEGLFYLGSINDNIFLLQTVISYNRDSYAATGTDGYSYQLTSDRNIRIYSSQDIRVSRLIDYLKTNPSYTVPRDQAFVELKSSPQALRQAARSYRELFSQLLTYHIQGIDRAGGKYSLSQKNNAFRLEQAFELHDQNALSAQITSEGALYFLIKGTSNLPSPPNRKKIVELGEIAIAIPFTIGNQTYRALVDYEPYILNGERFGVVDKFSIIDPSGKKVDLHDKVHLDIPQDLKNSPAPIQLLINNERLIFPSVLAPELVSAYKSFFTHFYTSYSKTEGNPREIEDLVSINSASQLRIYTLKMKAQNSLSYVWSRVHRIATQGLLIAGVTASVAYFTWQHQESLEPAMPSEIIEKAPVVSGFEVSTAGGESRYIVTKGPDGTWIALPIGSSAEVNNNNLP